MQSFTIGVYPGDGIGGEVTEQALRVLDEVQRASGDFRLELREFPWGVDYAATHGDVVPADFLDQLRPLDALFLGAVGWPERLPDHVTLAPLIRIRQAFDQYACVRPARLLPGVRSPLAQRRAGEIDMVVIRENSEGEYLDNGGRLRRGTADEVAVQTAVHSRRGVERIMRFGFDLAARRRRRLTMITKSNALKYSFVLWDEVLESLAPEFPEIEVSKQHVDAAAMNFVRRPQDFDVVVASNLFGDILTDLSAAIVGGLGLAPSANINPDRKFPSLFEPVHGSAPDIAGQGIANPVAAILSGAMMLDWLGRKQEADRIEAAVLAALSQGAATADLGGKLTTREMADAILAELS